MWGLFAGGLALLWALAAIFVLSLCRAAARADERPRAPRLRRRAATASVAAAVVVLPAVPDEASAACANRHLEFAANPQLMREALLCEIARVRARRDLPALRADAQLDLAAGRHAADMLERRFFSHTSPGGGDVADRVRRAGYALRRCSWVVGEILAWGTGPRATAAGTVRAWMRSPGHRHVLVSRRYRDVGAGLVAGTPADAAVGVTVAAVLGRRSC